MDSARALNIAHINIRSCRSKKLEIELFIRDNNLDILLLNETWLKKNDKFDISGFITLRKDRPDRPGGGVAIIIRRDIKFEFVDISIPTNNDNEHLTIKIKDKKSSLSITSIYIPPRHVVNQELIKTISKCADQAIIAGDFNAKHIDFNNDVSTRFGVKLRSTMSLHDLHLVDNDQPTHFNEKQKKEYLLDLIWSTPGAYFNINSLNINKDLSSDHYALLFNYNTTLSELLKDPIKVKLYHKANWKNINNSLTHKLNILKTQIDDLLSQNNSDPINILNNTANLLTDLITKTKDEIPEKTLKFKNSSIPNDIRTLIKEKRKIKRDYIKTKSLFMKQELNKISKHIKKLIKEHKKNDDQKRLNNLKLLKGEVWTRKKPYGNF